MALRDTWHRTLVYFGLVEEDDYLTEEWQLPEPEEELRDRYRETPNVCRLEGWRRCCDEFDDIFADDFLLCWGSGRSTTLRSVAGNGCVGGDVTVHFVILKSFNDTQ